MGPSFNIMNHFASTSAAALRPFTLQHAASSSTRGALQQCCLDALRQQQQQVRHFSRSPALHAGVNGSGPSMRGKKTPAAGSNEWLQEQLKAASLLENKKSPPPVKPDASALFVSYVPPRSHPFRPFSEDWLTLNWAWVLNWYQTIQATKPDFGLWGFKKQNEAIKGQIIPLYQAFLESKASGDIDAIRSRLSPEAIRSINEAAKGRQQQKLSASWKLHKVNKVSLESARTVEIVEQKPVTQAAVRFDTMQSLEVRNQAGQLLPTSGNHAEPQRVVENYVFERQLWKGPQAPWKLMEPTPTMTPAQAVGKQEGRFSQIAKPRKRVALTVI